MVTRTANALEDGTIVHEVARLMRIGFEREIRELGLTRTQWWVISVLVQMDGATQSEIAAFMQIERSPLGKVIDTLERDGWLERRADREDRRINRIFRTARIDTALPTMGRAAAHVFSQATKGIPAGERAILLRGLATMKENLSALVMEGDSR